MQHPQGSPFKYSAIKWPWLILSCISLGIGFSYLATTDMATDIATPVQLTQN